MDSPFDAAVFDAPGEPMRFAKLSVRQLRPDEVLVRLVATGICHTDLTVQSGAVPAPPPLVLGHEGSGVVERLGSGVTDLQPGDAVGMSFMSCGNCGSCHAHHPAGCDQFMALNFSGLRGDGTSALGEGAIVVGGHFFGQSSFARYSVANRRNVVKVGGDVPLELAGPFGCAFQTGAGAMFNTLRPRAGEACVVIGGGAVGLSAVMAAKVIGCAPIIVVEPRSARRDLALEIGATLTIDPRRQPMVAQVLAATGGGGAKAIVETTGISAVIDEAIDLLSNGGGIALIGLGEPTAMASFSVGKLLAKGATIRGVIEGDSDPQTFIPFLIDLFLKGQFPIDRLVRFYDFADINQAMADQASGVAIKPILRF
jgi:aryl-alcohol dehydrogenase